MTINLMPGCCRHFTGVQNDRCHKGIAYGSFKLFALAPCLPSTYDERKGKTKVACQHASFPTHAEVEAADRANEAEFHAHIEALRSREAK